MHVYLYLGFQNQFFAKRGNRKNLFLFTCIFKGKNGAFKKFQTVVIFGEKKSDFHPKIRIFVFRLWFSFSPMLNAEN